MIRTLSSRTTRTTTSWSTRQRIITTTNIALRQRQDSSLLSYSSLHSYEYMTCHRPPIIQQQQQQQQNRYMGVSIKHRSPYRVNEKIRAAEDQERERRTKIREKMNAKHNNTPLSRIQANQLKKYRNKFKLQLCHSDYDLFMDGAGMNDDDDEDEYDIIDDEEEDTEDFMYSAVEWDIDDIKDKVEEMFDTSNNLQYYDDNKRVWKDFPTSNETMMIELSRYKHGKVPLKVRVPEIYDSMNSRSNTTSSSSSLNNEMDSNIYNSRDITGSSTSGSKLRKNQWMESENNTGTNNDDNNDVDYDDEDDDIDDEDVEGAIDPTDYGDVVSRMNNGMKLSMMEDTIYDLVDDLRKSHYIRSPTKPFTMILSPDGIKQQQQQQTTTAKKHPKEIATKDWLIQQASINPKVEAVLLGYVGSIDHIVQCLHYDMVWKQHPEITLDMDDEEERLRPRIRNMNELDNEDIQDYQDTVRVLNRYAKQAGGK